MANSTHPTCPIWANKAKPEAPPFNLDLIAATYLGSSSEPFVPVALTTIGSTIVVAGNGPTSTLDAPHTVSILNGSTTSNASLVFFEVGGGGAAAGVKATYVVKVGDRIDFVRANQQGNLAIAGSFGLARVTCHGDNCHMDWQQTFPSYMPGSCGLCCDQGKAVRFCRTSIGDDGTVALVLPLAGKTVILSYDQAGSQLGRLLVNDDITDITVLSSKSIVYSWLYDSSTGHEPMVMPGTRLVQYDLQTKWRAWPWR